MFYKLGVFDVQVGILFTVLMKDRPMGKVYDGKGPVLSPQTLTERQKREREFYDQFAEKRHVDKVDLSPVSGKEERPWNSYWYIFQRARELKEEQTQKLLDFGCGQGNNSILLAHLGYEVHGFDISEKNIISARKLAEYEERWASTLGRKMARNYRLKERFGPAQRARGELSAGSCRATQSSGQRAAHPSPKCRGSCAAAQREKSLQQRRS